MNITKTITTAFAALAVMLAALAPTALAVQYEYVPGYGMMPVSQEDGYEPSSVDNSGTFGLSVDDFRYMCMDTGGEWNVVNGRHVCHCEAGEFNFPFGCPDVVFIETESSNEPYYPPQPAPMPYPEDMYDPYGDPYYDPYASYLDEGYYPGGGYDDMDYPERFWDTGGHPYEGYIMELARIGIIEGYPDGSFRPEQPVNRAEMAKMAMMAAKVQPVPGDEDRNRFFADLDNWNAPWVNAGYRLDIIEGYSSTQSGVRLFRPDVWVNRVEGVKLVLAAFGERPLDFDKISFVDVYDWMVPWIEDAYRIGLIDNQPNGRFYPAEPMTRAMAAKVIVKMLQYAGDI